jgi:hypothetical protein
MAPRSADITTANAICSTSAIITTIFIRAVSRMNDGGGGAPIAAAWRCYVVKMTKMVMVIAGSRGISTTIAITTAVRDTWMMRVVCSWVVVVMGVVVVAADGGWRKVVLLGVGHPR